MRIAPASRARRAARCLQFRLKARQGWSSLARSNNESNAFPGGVSMASDPYAAPKARVEDVREAHEAAQFVAGGQSVPAGNGWQWIAQGWSLFMRQPAMWILLTIAAFAIFFVLGLIPIAGFVASSLLWPVLWAGFAIACRDLERGEELRLGHLFAGFRNRPGRLIAIGALVLAAMIAIFAVAALLAGLSATGMFSSVMLGRPDAEFVGAGLALLVWMLIVLGLSIPVYMASWFAPALVALHGLAVGDALKASLRASLKNVLPFLLYGAVLFAFAIVASIPLGLGWLALGPVLIASVYASYRDIFTAH
jgi:uncharacterized membrane protein